MTMDEHTLLQREQAADAAFESYGFGEGVKVVGHDRWNRDDRRDFNKIVYVQFEDDAPDAPSTKVSFHVRFGGDGQLDEAYGLLMTTGADIGCPAAVAGMT